MGAWPCFRGLAFAALLLTSWTAAAQAQQSLRPRVVPEKPTLDQMQAVRSLNRVIVKFREGSGVRLLGGQLTGGDNPAQFLQALGEYGIPLSAMQRLFRGPEADHDAKRQEGQRRSGRELADLNLYYIITLPPGQTPAVIANRLNALPIVERAEPEPIAQLPADIPPTTPDMAAAQTYKGAPFTGINLPTPAQIPGSDGAGFQVADVESGWTRDHEDFPATTTVGCAPSTTNMGTINHGTAVVGIIAAPSNGYGVTGIAPAATVFLASTDSTTNPDCTSNVGVAINAAAQVLVAGDVIVIEKELAVCGGTPCTQNDQTGCGPVEAFQAYYDAIANATALGILVMEPAGNGSVNLDAPACNGIFDRNVRDSGAIMVGAGSATNRSRLNFSSYGSRVDLQGWGQSVVTTGYGDRFFPNSDNRQSYTSVFGGTSSATPIVAGAALSVQGALRSVNLGPLTPAQMRNLLVSTGSPQPSPDTGHIGPLPNVRAALNATNITQFLPGLTVSPATNQSFSGRQGGPFGASPRTIKSTTGTLNFQITTPPWLSITPSSTGSAGTGGTTVFLQPNAYAQTLAPGSYGPDFITYTNTTNGLGDVTYTVTLDVRPVNDTFSAGYTIGVNQSLSGTNVNATKEAGEPTHANNAGGRSVWWAYNAQVSSPVTISTAGSNFDTLLAVYTGSSVNALALVAQNDDFNNTPQSQLTFQAVAGTTYFIAVDGFNEGLGADQGSISIRLTVPTLQVSGPTFLTSSGHPGGPFSPASFDYQLNSSGGILAYSITNIPSWLTASQTSGTVASSPVTITFTVNSSANALAVGTYGPTSISFDNANWSAGNTTRPATLIVSAATEEATHDANNDGKSDILWRQNGGAIAGWLMNGAQVSQSGIIASVSANWQIVGQRDFNGDGKYDLLWRDTTSGAVALWFLNGLQVAATASVATVPSQWVVAGTGDFNADGKGDLLWRDSSSGTVAVWLMNGASASQTGSLGTVAAPWTIVGVGDFDGDGKGDILWRNTTTGATAIWFLNGLQVSSTGSFGTVATSWSIIATGDFNGDGKTDLLWRDSSGTVAIWLMNGSQVLQTGVLGSVPVSWTAAETGDFDGDGKSDILWRNTANGAVAIWFMNGVQVSSPAPVGTVGLDWTVQSVNVN
jgi:hypothetical protein